MPGRGAAPRAVGCGEKEPSTQTALKTPQPFFLGGLSFTDSLRADRPTAGARVPGGVQTRSAVSERSRTNEP